MKTDIIEVEILADGTIKMSADKISMPSHASAEMFVREVAREAGGKTERRHKHGGKLHSHHSTEEHHEH